MNSLSHSERSEESIKHSGFLGRVRSLGMTKPNASGLAMNSQEKHSRKTEGLYLPMYALRNDICMTMANSVSCPTAAYFVGDAGEHGKYRPEG